MGLSTGIRYSKDMLSGAFVLCNVADEARQSKETHKVLMMTADGFQWPVPKGPGEFTKPNFALDAGRKDELEQPWVRCSCARCEELAVVVTCDCCCRWRACGSSRSTAALVLCRKKVD
jgi:hypothetical protein